MLNDNVFDVSKEISLLTDVLNISESDLAKELDVSFVTLNNWKKNKKIISLDNLNNLYDFAYTNGIVFNNIYEQLLKEEYSAKNNIVLFHGTKKDFEFPIDIQKHSKANNDFGIGFYLDESYKQASAYISSSISNSVLAFSLDTDKYNILKYNVDRDWMLTISYFRGMLKSYADNKLIKKLISKLDDVDVIIAPIADNRMFDIINEFCEGYITDEQCNHALAATNLGYQYVLKTDKVINSLSFLRELFVSDKEKEDIVETRLSISKDGFNKVKMARIEYRGKGKYIEELLQ